MGRRATWPPRDMVAARHGRRATWAAARHGPPRCQPGDVPPAARERTVFGKPGRGRTPPCGGVGITAFPAAPLGAVQHPPFVDAGAVGGHRAQKLGSRSKTRFALKNPARAQKPASRSKTRQRRTSGGMLSITVQVWRNCPSVVRNCPSVGRNCPSVCRNCPSVCRNCPSVGGNCPSVGGNCPSVSSLGWSATESTVRRWRVRLTIWLTLNNAARAENPAGAQQPGWRSKPPGGGRG
jgi:hypothetical protein